jgi:hypothetical protein
MDDADEKLLLVNSYARKIVALILLVDLFKIVPFES